MIGRPSTCLDAGLARGICCRSLLEHGRPQYDGADGQRGVAHDDEDVDGGTHDAQRERELDVQPARDGLRTASLRFAELTTISVPAKSEALVSVACN